MCSGVKTSPDLAVFANGTMIRYLDFNDGYMSLGGGHPSDTIASLLSTAEVGRFDDFFTLGGDSILSVQLAARARAAGLAINPRMVFENPTVQQLAAAVDALEASGDGASPDNGDDASETRFEPMTTSGLSATDLAAVTRLWAKSRDGTS